MTDRGGDDGRFHGGWATVGLAAPFAPGTSIPEGWQRFTVTFSRVESTDDGHGGYTDSAPNVVLTTQATVYEAPDPSGPYPMVSGTRAEKRLRIRLSPIPTGDAMPRIGDRVMIQTDSMSDPMRATVSNVSSPLLLSDHTLVQATRGR